MDIFCWDMIKSDEIQYKNTKAQMSTLISTPPHPLKKGNLLNGLGFKSWI